MGVTTPVTALVTCSVASQVVDIPSLAAARQLSALDGRGVFVAVGKAV